MFTDIFSRLIIRDTVENNTSQNESSTVSTSNNDPGVMKYAVAEEKVTINKKVQFTEEPKEKVKDVNFYLQH